MAMEIGGSDGSGGEGSRYGEPTLAYERHENSS